MLKFPKFVDFYVACLKHVQLSRTTAFSITEKKPTTNVKNYSFLNILNAKWEMNNETKKVCFLNMTYIRLTPTVSLNNSYSGILAIYFAYLPTHTNGS